MGNWDEPLTFVVNGKPVTSADEAQAASRPAGTLRGTADAFMRLHGPRFQKLNHWHAQQPRDRYGKWTKGFVSGAYSPLSKPKAGDVAPIVSHEAGSPFAPGGAYHGNAGGWQTGKKAVGQAAGSARPDIGGGNVALGGAKPLALGPGGPTVDPEVAQTAGGAASANGDPAGGAVAGADAAGGAPGKLTPPVIPKAPKVTAAEKKAQADGQKAFEAVLADKDGWQTKAKKILTKNPAAHEHMTALLQARADDPKMSADQREWAQAHIEGLKDWSPEGQARGAEIRQSIKTTKDTDEAAVYALGSSEHDKATAILDANPDVAAKLEAIANGAFDADKRDEWYSPGQRKAIGEFLHDYRERRRPIGPVDSDNPEADDAIAGSLNVTRHDGSTGQIAGTQWQHPAGARWDAGLKDLDLHNPIDDSGFKAAKASALNAYATSSRAVERVNAAIAKAGPAEADALRKKYAPLFYDHARIKKIADEINDSRYATYRQGINALEKHSKSADIAAGIAQQAPTSFRDAVDKGLLGNTSRGGPAPVHTLAEQLELHSGQPAVRNAELPGVDTERYGVSTAGESYEGNAGGPARWDATLPKGQADAHGAVANAHDHLRSNVDRAEAAMKDGTLDERANMRERYAAMYYDMHRAARVARANGPAEKKAALAHLRATTGIAKMIAAGKFDTLDDAVRNGRVKLGAKHKGAATDNLVAREYLLHKHSVDVRHDMNNLDKGAQAGAKRRGDFTFHAADDPKTLDHAREIDEAIDGTFGKNARGSRVTSIANADAADSTKWTPSHAIPGYGHINMINNYGGDEFRTPGEYKRTIAHEMAHALSGNQLKPEYSQFNDYMRANIPEKSGTAKGVYADTDDERGKIDQTRDLATQKDARGERPHLRQFITQHGANEKDHEQKEYQEDWAIGLSDGGLSDFRGVGARAAGLGKGGSVNAALPTKEAAQKLEQIFGKKAVAGTDHLRDMPKVDGDGYQIGESPQQKAEREAYMREAHSDSDDHASEYPGHEEMERRMGGRDAVTARLTERAERRERWRQKLGTR